MTAADIARALGGARRAGAGWVARCPAHEDRIPSLSLADGDDGRLLARCHAGCDWSAILDALRGLGLVEGASGWTGSAEPHPAEAARRAAEDAAQRAKRAAQAERCWREAGPIHGTVAERYMLGRAITAPLPEVLRFHPACWHASTAKKLPAMIARVDGGEGFAVHRTYLTPEGHKAAAEPAKAMLGAVKGGAVRLVGAYRRLVVAEGIETALSLPSGLLDAPASVWAALSAGGMETLRLPRAGRGAELIVALDGDTRGRAAGHALAKRATDRGWSVSIADPGDGRDWNDRLREAAQAAPVPEREGAP